MATNNATVSVSLTDLQRAVATADYIPNVPAAERDGIVQSAMLKLGLCCLGREKVLLDLENGYELHVTMRRKTK